MRIVGIAQSLAMMVNGKHHSVESLSDSGIFDAIIAKDADSPLANLEQMSITFALQLIANGEIKLDPVGKRTVTADAFDWDIEKAKIVKKARGRLAPLAIFDVLQKTWNKDITEGMQVERAAFVKLLESEQSAALRQAFIAEKLAAKYSSDATQINVTKVGIIGGGTMGVGICTSFINAGFKVQLIEQTAEAANIAFSRIQQNMKDACTKGRINQTQLEQRLSLVAVSHDKTTLYDCQLIIEAVFEDIEVKKSLFKELDNICDANTIFATNTSYLDIDDIASSTQYPQRVIGMHFFSPAHIMKLLEVVQTQQSSDTALVTALSIGKKLGKISVLVKVCFGFAANRMYSRYGRETQQMLMEGATVEQIDTAMTDWGMAMGPLAVQDLSGIDIGYNARKSKAFPKDDPGYFKASSTMVSNGRLGRKTQKGFYTYDDNGRASKDPEVERLIKEQAALLGFKQRNFEPDEIVHRALFAIISEGFKLMDDNIVQRLSDIDVIWLHGYGFPRYRGGPMFQAQQLGFDTIKKNIEQLKHQFGEQFWPDIKNEF
jgi:3-hydroxyacyl-CoA dehydrogenase